MQKIIACERLSIPCHCTELCLNDCRFTALKSVAVSGTAVCTFADGRTLCLAIPVNVTACDGYGRCCTLPSSVRAEISLPRSCFHANDPRTSLLAVPCVRLLRSECTGSGCFRVQLHIQLEIYLLRCDTCGCTFSNPACPQLPLYPPPLC